MTKTLFLNNTPNTPPKPLSMTFSRLAQGALSHSTMVDPRSDKGCLKSPQLCSTASLQARPSRQVSTRPDCENSDCGSSGASRRNREIFKEATADPRVTRERLMFDPTVCLSVEQGKPCPDCDTPMVEADDMDCARANFVCPDCAPDFVKELATTADI